MFPFDKENFNRWLGCMHSNGYTIIGYVCKPIAFFVDIPINIDKDEK